MRSATIYVRSTPFLRDLHETTSSGPECSLPHFFLIFDFFIASVNVVFSTSVPLPPFPRRTLAAALEAISEKAKQLHCFKTPTFQPAESNGEKLRCTWRNYISGFLSSSVSLSVYTNNRAKIICLRRQSIHRNNNPIVPTLEQRQADGS